MPSNADTVRGYATSSLRTVAIVFGAVIAGALLGTAWSLATGADMAMWVTARASGIAAYLMLTLAVMTGLVLSSPGRWRIRWPSSPQRVRLHVLITVSTLLFLALHIVVLALDPWAKVGWAGALLPWGSEYRPVPVALGVLSMWAFVLIFVSAGLAGRITGSRWRGLHRISLGVWALAWIHGLLAGSDTGALLPVYVISGLMVIVIAAWRYGSPSGRRSRPAWRYGSTSGRPSRPAWRYGSPSGRRSRPAWRPLSPEDARAVMLTESRRGSSR